MVNPVPDSLHGADVAIEPRSLDELYQAALTEGGRLIVYAGGDTAGQQDGPKAAFEAQFPGVTLDIIVDYSKFHNGRIDNQFATNTLVPDVVQLQTLQDFPRWKAAGVLLPYKPQGWEQVYPAYRDQDGFYTAITVLAFSNVVDTHALTPDQWPTEMQDYLRPDLKGRLICTYPTDDDAVLYWFKLAVDKYGWDYVAQIKEQAMHFVRGTQAPADEVEAGHYPATFSTSGALKVDPSARSRFVLPKADPFVAWGQRAAIFKDAQHPEAAKLYLNWWLSQATQQHVGSMWSVRTDVQPPAGYTYIWDYPQIDVRGFEQFMADREAVELFRTQMALYLGEAQGEPSPGHLGLHPERALPH